ncbi:P-loop containing nucleoside triphosphate hydrolase protein [Syncephalastrum racemosum]|uniref:P-loop containing nucleoside triphosphate hydrolase protein n=1 Tax=Syncephalastrum racemosum TaxID=13706 RepID=A0A1X2HTL8_SYNRA|nr:P-loop containing nucleoside triphosphate hydrolase protein [Syncephalastrum racemosum]
MTFSSAAFTDAACEAAARDPETLVVSALGAVGVGKSSLLNAIAGERLFDVGDTYATTQEIQGEVRPWKYAPTTKYAHLIDTPGLCDSLAHDRQNVQEMVRYFKTLAYGVSSFLLVFDIKDIRLDAYTQDMLSLFQQLLGKDFWNFVVIVFTHVDEDCRDELDDAIEAVLDPEDGFVTEIARLYKLSTKTFVPTVIFATTQNVRMSNYAQRQVRDIYNAVVRCETRNDHRRFNCTWLRQIMAYQNEDEKTDFIKQSIIGAWSTVASSVCHLQ